MTDDKKSIEKPKAAAKKPEPRVRRLVCHAPFGVAIIDGERVRFRRGDAIHNPKKETVASADPASWEQVKG